MLSNILQEQIKNKSLFHSYIFEGNDVACQNQYLEFAKALYKTDKDVNSFIEVIGKEGNGIPIDKIRQINKDVFEKPVGFSHKIYVIKDAHLMRVEAQNAMLKTLEEMPEYSIIIMATDNKFKLLDTIISRSQVIRLFDAFDLDFSSETTQNIISLLKKSLENNYYIISKDKNLIKDLSESKYESLHILSKIFSDALFTDPRSIDRPEYRNLITDISRFSKRQIETILLNLEKIKGLLKVNLNFQMAMENLIFTIIEFNKKQKEVRG